LLLLAAGFAHASAEVAEIVCVAATANFDRRWAGETAKIMERFRPKILARWIKDKSIAETVAFHGGGFSASNAEGGGSRICFSLAPDRERPV
jgi:hypothetical protein